DHLRGPRPWGRRVGGVGAGPPPGAAADGQRLPLDRPLPGADARPAAPPGPPRRRAEAGVPRSGRDRRGAGADEVLQGAGVELRVPRPLLAIARLRPSSAGSGMRLTRAV